MQRGELVALPLLSPRSLHPLRRGDRPSFSLMPALYVQTMVRPYLEFERVVVSPLAVFHIHSVSRARSVTCALSSSPGPELSDAHSVPLIAVLVH